MSLPSLDEIIQRIRANRDEVLVLAGALLVFMTFVAKEGLHEKWQKDAETLDTAQYMYSLSVVSFDSDRKLSLVLNRLDQLEQKSLSPARKKGAPISGADIIDYPGALSENTRLADSLSNTLILVERMPALKSYQQECEYFREQLEHARTELEFLKNIYVPNAGYFLKEHQPWTYTPKDPIDTYQIHWNPVDPGRKLTPLQATLDSDNQYFDLLRQDVSRFNKRILEEAKALRARDERYSAIAWRFSAVFYILGSVLALIGKLLKLPVAGGSE